MKCQACFRHSETVKNPSRPPPPPPPPPPSSYSSSSSHQPVTPQTFSPTSPTRLPLPTTSHSHDQIIFQPPEICLARQKSAAQSWFSAQAHTQPSPLLLEPQNRSSFFYQLGLLVSFFLGQTNKLPLRVRTLSIWAAAIVPESTWILKAGTAWTQVSRFGRGGGGWVGWMKSVEWATVMSTRQRKRTDKSEDKSSF